MARRQVVARARTRSVNSCFVVMPINNNYALQSYYEEAIIPAVKKAGLSPVRIDKKVIIGKITEEIAREIDQAQIVLVDTTEDRPNCYFEAGYAVAKGKPIIWLRSETLADVKIPFDVKDFQFILYKTLRDLRERLGHALTAVLDGRAG